MDGIPCLVIQILLSDYLISPSFQLIIRVCEFDLAHAQDFFVLWFFFLGQDSQINLGHNIHIYRMDSNRFVAKSGFVVLLSALLVKVIMIDNTDIFLLVKFTLIP